MIIRKSLKNMKKEVRKNLTEAIHLQSYWTGSNFGSHWDFVKRTWPLGSEIPGFNSSSKLCVLGQIPSG